MNSSSVVQTQDQIECKINYSYCQVSKKDPIIDKVFATEEQHEEEDSIHYCEGENLDWVVLQQESGSCRSKQVAPYSANWLREETAQFALGADQEHFCVFFLAVAVAERVDCRAVEHENKEHCHTGSRVHFVVESEVEQQSHLYEAVECQLHDVGLDYHHEQTPPHQTGFKFKVGTAQTSKIPTQYTKKEKQYPQKHKQKDVKQEIGLVGVLGWVCEVDPGWVFPVVGSEMLPVLKVGALLYSVIIDTLNKWKEIKREGIEPNYVGQVYVLEDGLQKLRVLGLMVVVVRHVVKVEDTQPDEVGCDSAWGQGQSQQRVLDRFWQLDLRHNLWFPRAHGGACVEEVAAHALITKSGLITVVIFINMVYLGSTIWKWVFSISYKRVLVQIIYFVIVPGILHLWNENLNLDVILNEAFLLRNKKIGIEYCNINNEFI